MLPILFAAMAVDDDGSLAERLRRREPGALDQLYERYGTVVYSLLLRMVRERSVAEDLTQETFLRVWHRAHLIDHSRGAIGAWLLAVARNQGLDYLRSARGKAAQHTISLEESIGSHFSVDMERDLLTVDQSRRVRAVFGRLTDQQRQVIELAYFEGLTQSEMAERLGQPLGTVKTWVRTALQTLRVELTASKATVP